MTDAKIREVLDLYERKLVGLIVQEHIHPANSQLKHCAIVMIPKMREMLQQIEHQAIPPHDDLRLDQRVALAREKLMRWLGFIQGVCSRTASTPSTRCERTTCRMAKR